MSSFAPYLNYIYIVGGLLGLFLGGEGLIRGAVSIAKRFGLPKLLIGLTIVGFGTSLPELLVCLKAALNGTPDIAIGNVVGSNIANVLLIAMCGALIYPVATTTVGLKRDVFVMFMSSIAITILAFSGTIDLYQGALLVLALITYLGIVYINQGKSPVTDDEPDLKPLSLGVASLWVIVSMTMLIFGADYLVRGATVVAHDFGVSEAVIGLTLVAIGTSLPELTVSLMSALRKQNEVALGNVIGSNIFNSLGILGITAMAKPISIDQHFLVIDLPMMAASSLFIAVLIFTKPKIGRMSALFGLATYGLYISFVAGLWSIG